ncbi:MAG: winged helix-turn-helix transcriptional regulator, partial [Pseudonocardiales bacterium]|nr:winged helix-turn-helix transcriptional regulator [Pseudonocardiales bacterium]
LSQTVFDLVAQASMGMRRSFDLPRVQVLGVITGEGPVRPAQIGARLRMPPSTVTRHVQALEDAGQVTIRPDPHDQRTCLIETTDTGRAEITALTEAGNATVGQVLTDWSTDDISTLTVLLRRLMDDWNTRHQAARRQVTPRRPPRWRHPPN